MVMLGLFIIVLTYIMKAIIKLYFDYLRCHNVINTFVYSNLRCTASRQAILACSSVFTQKDYEV